MSFKISKHKKGGAPSDEAFGLIFFIIIAVFGIFIVRLLNVSSENKITEESFNQKTYTDAHSNLMLFLRQQNNGISIAENMVNFYYAEDFSSLEQPIKQFFNAKYRGDWILVIEDSKGDTVLSANPNNFLVRASISSVTTREEVAMVYLPINSMNNAGYLKIRLMLIRFDIGRARESPLGA